MDRKVELWLLRLSGSFPDVRGTRAGTSSWEEKALARAATEGNEGGKTAILVGGVSDSSLDGRSTEGFLGSRGLGAWVKTVG